MIHQPMSDKFISIHTNTPWRKIKEKFVPLIYRDGQEGIEKVVGSAYLEQGTLQNINVRLGYFDEEDRVWFDGIRTSPPLRVHESDKFTNYTLLQLQVNSRSGAITEVVLSRYYFPEYPNNSRIDASQLIPNSHLYLQRDEPEEIIVEFNTEKELRVIHEIIDNKSIVRVHIRKEHNG